jgi:hypothetical protein
MLVRDTPCAAHAPKQHPWRISADIEAWPQPIVTDRKQTIRSGRA